MGMTSKQVASKRVHPDCAGKNFSAVLFGHQLALRPSLAGPPAPLKDITRGPSLLLETSVSI